MARRRSRKERRSRRFSRRNPLSEQYADEPYDDSTWEAWAGLGPKGAWLGHPSKKALLEFARVQDDKAKHDVSPMESISGWADTFPPPEGIKEGLAAARDNLRRLKIVLKQQGIDLDELQKSDPERAKATWKAVIQDHYYNEKGEAVKRLVPFSLRFPAGPEVIDRLIEIGNKQNFWMLPSEGPLNVFEAYNTFGYPEKPTRKKLQKLQKKKRNAIRERRKKAGPAKLHYFKAVHPVQGEEQGWTLLQTEEEYKDVGDRFGNCLWWNHWYNDREADRVYYRKDPGLGVETIARYEFYPGKPPSLDEVAVHFGHPTTWVLSPSPRAEKWGELEYVVAPYSSPTQRKRTQAMRREIQNWLDWQRVDYAMPREEQLMNRWKAELPELMQRDGQGTITKEEEEWLDRIFVQVAGIIRKHGGLTNIRVQYPATVESGRSEDLDELIERAARVLVAGEPGLDKISTPVERIYRQEVEASETFEKVMGKAAWPNPRGKKMASRQKKKTTRRRRARKNPRMSDVRLYQDILAHLRALQWVYWTTHWQVSGDNFYGDHLLLNRLYDGRGGGPKINDQIDDLGERMVAYFGASSVNPAVINGKVHEVLRDPGEWMYGPVEDEEDPGTLDQLYRLEGRLQGAIRSAWQANQKSDAHMSLGLDDYLMSLANERDTAIYLLGRRLGGKTPLAKQVFASKNPMTDDWHPSRWKVLRPSYGRKERGAKADILVYRVKVDPSDWTRPPTRIEYQFRPGRGARTKGSLDIDLGGRASTVGLGNYSGLAQAARAAKKHYEGMISKTAKVQVDLQPSAPRPFMDDSPDASKRPWVFKPLAYPYLSPYAWNKGHELHPRRGEDPRKVLGWDLERVDARGHRLPAVLGFADTPAEANAIIAEHLRQAGFPAVAATSRKNPRRKMPRRNSKGQFIKSRRSSARKKRK